MAQAPIDAPNVNPARTKPILRSRRLRSSWSGLATPSRSMRQRSAANWVRLLVIAVVGA